MSGVSIMWLTTSVECVYIEYEIITHSLQIRRTGEEEKEFTTLCEIYFGPMKPLPSRKWPMSWQGGGKEFASLCESVFFFLPMKTLPS